MRPARSRITWAAFGSALAIATATAAATVPSTGAAAANGLIAFTRYADEQRSSGSIFVVDANGDGDRRVTRAVAGARDFQADWSPDGTRIVFERQHEGKPYETFTVKPDGSELTRIDPGCSAGVAGPCEEVAPAWSPDGKRIAYQILFGGPKPVRDEVWIAVGGIAVMNVDGTGLRQLTQLRRPTSSEDFEPFRSPDGTRIGFVRRNGTARPHGLRAIHVMNADGTGSRRVTPWRLDAGDHPVWSPDGRWILFRSPEGRGFAGSDLYRVRPDGTGLKQLTSDAPTVEVLSASYAPDGKAIVFSRTGRGGLPDLFTMRPDGTGLRQVTRTTAWDSAPDWGPQAD